MTANRRISLNIIATYGRSLFSLVCGLFTARWVLSALGHEDFGLYGVVGGLTIIISFMNLMLSAAVSRYYAVAIGEAKKLCGLGKSDDGLAQCRAWFNTALLIHTVIPTILLIVGYPLGVFLIKSFLAIPDGKILNCIYVWRFTCLSCFIGMVNVPFNSMYVAKQYIAELTLYSFAQTVANVVYFYYMATHPGEWLVKYAAWMSFVTIIPQVVICLRAMAIFPECKIVRRYLWDAGRFNQLCQYAFWQTFGGLGVVIRNQGMAILVNKYFGAKINASVTVANQVSAHTQTLASALQTAFQPAIATAWGSGDHPLVKSLSFRACKFAVILTMLFSLPLMLEVDEVMTVWLKDPPPYSAGLCVCMLVFWVVDKASIGHSLACNATGHIAAYQAVGGSFLIMCLPIAWVLVRFGCGVYSIGIAIVATALANTVSRVFFARRLVGMSVRHWVVKIMGPIAIAALLGILSGRIAMSSMGQSITRVLVTTLAVEVVFLPLCWALVLTQGERGYVIGAFRRCTHL